MPFNLHDISASGFDLSVTTEELSKLEPYVDYFEEDGVRLQALDSDAALRDGFAREVILLAEEMVTFQNDLLKAASTGVATDSAQKDVFVVRFPRLANFFELASAKTKTTTKLAVDQNYR